MSLPLRRTYRLFWCYQCQRSVGIISSPAFEVSLCPRCFGSFIHEVSFPHPRPTPAFIHPLPHPLLVVPTRPIEPPSRSTATPGDYFSGPGLSELIGQLTQNDRPGPPPAPGSAIDAMPVVLVGEAHLRDGSQCPVCKEEFEVGEEAREMPCKHVYHSDCIVPWLRMHNSCPVCRFQLPGSSGGNHSNARRNESEDSRRSGSSGGGGGGGVRRGPTRWNPIPLLWPFRGSVAARWEYDYRSRTEEEDPLDNPGALYSWLHSWFLL